MENQAAELLQQQSYEDVRKSGYLRKQKSMHRRFFVLREASEQGPARLEYYENEKKFRSKSPIPKKALNLETCFNINKRADSKNKHMIILYTRGESFAIAADSEDVQNEWYQAMLDLQWKCKSPEDCGSGGECGLPSPPGPAFKEVWQVKVWPKGLGQARNLVGIYRLCLTDKTVNFVKLNSDVAAVVLQLMNVRRCGHSENFFFIEVGRSAMTGPGEFWMQVEDSVVAQNMHETLLEAMKALSEEFRQRSKSQSVGATGGGGTASNPISVPTRRHHPNLPPSQVGFGRRARTETPGAGGANCTSTSPTPRHGFPRARTASIGGRTEEGGGGARGAWASSSPSLNGSCSTTPTLRPKPTRAPTPAKITLSLARYTPNPAPSPAPSLSSSSGHGSECGLVGGAMGGVAICSYTRVPQRVSVSGSPSDYGSSDEYGSSPGEHSLLVPSLPGGSNGGIGHHAHGEGSSSYIVMGQRESLPESHQRPQGRRMLRRSSSRECEAERRLLSKRASLPLTAHERLAPRRKEEEEDEDQEYAVMSRSVSRDAFVSRRRGSGGSAAGGLEAGAMVGETQARVDVVRGDAGGGGGGGGHMDSGYMSMLPGVTAPPVSLSLSVAVSDVSTKPGAEDEYMAMTPNNSMSPPQHIRLPVSEGYMVMSPNSSCSPDMLGMAMWGSRGSMESRAGSDYMNMSPISIRSACSTPPSQPEQNPLQPKMIYSYFSLPRSYKHTLSTRFKDDLDQGKRKEGGHHDQDSAGNRGGQVGYSKRDTATVGPAGGCQLCLSSSSFSSSSASSESLEDRPMSVAAGGGLRLTRTGPGFRNGGARSKDGSYQQKRASHGPGGQQRKARPLSVSVDMSKANTLPRVKENLFPTVPQSPGEYVSIVFRGGDVGGRRGGQWGPEHGLSVTHGTPRPLHHPALCHGGSTNLPRSFSAPLATSAALAASAEYVNMDLGMGNSRCTSPGTPVKSPFCLPPAIAPKPRVVARSRPSPRAAEDNVGGHLAAVPTDLPTSYTDYTEMAFSMGSEPNPAPPTMHTAQASSMEQESGLDFPSVKSYSSPDQNQSSRLARDRVDRGDQLGRRRHRSETFIMTPPSLPLHLSSSGSLFLESAQAAAPHRHGGLERGSPWENAPAAQASSSGSAKQGLNYIDLDLAINKDSSQTEMEGGATAPHNIFSPVHNGAGGGVMMGDMTGLGNNPGYASIDFYKSEELRAHHQSSRKDGKEC
ncbi:insulin receptor substrate 1-B-like isoform X2 [Coregonus clupeaformis]|uniref:insulin receptor substrate 1-B-like isoform X2 n=1 Tax=Coregonus clupeaformis TaxID=59861 RepID=UPI001E1C50BA|nr:insulin receptor substrate 1-B-like isoform X2 [Coregonus clupeaformis]